MNIEFEELRKAVENLRKLKVANRYFFDSYCKEASDILEFMMDAFKICKEAQNGQTRT